MVSVCLANTMKDFGTDMKKLLSEPLTYVFAYLVVAIFTFGHCYNQYPNEEHGNFGGTNYTITNGPGTKGVGSLVLSALWPLYWSVKLQEKQ